MEDHVDYQSVISDLKDLMLDSQVLLYYHTLLLYSSYPDYYSYIFLILEGQEKYASIRTTELTNIRINEPMEIEIFS